MAKIDFGSLYDLQDAVLAAIISASTSLYLTGGTCLNRFYLHGRYSEDLDLFTNDTSLFRDDVRRVQDVLKENNHAFEKRVDTRDFARFIIADRLQMDLVNDRVPRIGGICLTDGGIRIDSFDNIAANKISAVMGRDEAKDVFDLYLIARCRQFSWDDILAGANAKALLSIEDLEYRLQSFPIELLHVLHISNETLLAEMKQEYTVFIREIVSRAPNSLFRK